MLYGIIKSLVCLFVLLTIPLSIAWTLQSPTRPPHARFVVALSLSFDSSERDELSIEDRNEAASQNVLEDDATSVSGTRGATKRRRLQSRPIRRDSTNSNLPMNRMQQERNEQIQKAQERYMEALKDPTLFANGSTQSNSNNSSHFDTIQPKISSATMRAIHEVLLLRQMTEIQCRTFPMAVQGASVLGRARTGTGKTIAYLLPAIERLLQMDNKIFRPGRTIGIIIVAPTRELVIQISQEATKLLTFHHGYTVQPLYGGISIQRDRAILFHRPIPTILVSTPGRLYDLLRDSSLLRVHGNRNFVDVVNECPIVIFDEADRLMEGFTTEINTISSYLPRIEKRQTMLFSATISLKLKHVLQNGYPKMLPSEYASVDCVKDDDITTHINQRVSQTFVLLADMRSYVSGFLSIVDSLMKNDNNSQSNTKKSKVLIFLPTAKLVKFFKEVLNHISLLSSGQGYDVYSIHSRMSQGSRNRASTQFRAVNNKNCILLSSDVSARGVDYPDVTFVVQYGAPYNDELYVHRLGRTGRAGQEGSGLLVLLPFETRFLSKCRKYNIRENSERFNNINNPNSDIDSLLQVVQSAVRDGHVLLSPSAEAAYISFVAHYLEYSRDKHLNGTTGVLNAAVELGKSFGLPSLPKLPLNIEQRIKTKNGTQL